MLCEERPKTHVSVLFLGYLPVSEISESQGTQTVDLVGATSFPHDGTSLLSEKLRSLYVITYT